MSGCQGQAKTNWVTQRDWRKRSREALCVSLPAWRDWCEEKCLGCEESAQSHRSASASLPDQTSPTKSDRREAKWCEAGTTPASSITPPTLSWFPVGLSVDWWLDQSARVTLACTVSDFGGIFIIAVKVVILSSVHDSLTFSFCSSLGQTSIQMGKAVKEINRKNIPWRIRTLLVSILSDSAAVLS